MTLEQLPSAGLLTTSEQVVAGRVNTAGSGSIVTGSGFTIVRNGTGDITITFTTAFSSVPTVVYSGETGSGSNNVTLMPFSNPTTTSVRLVCSVQTTAAAQDGIFGFIAYIPSTTKTRIPRDYGIVTALPTTPTPATGDQCTYTDSLTAPTYNWRLMYNGSDSSSTKWECIGGSPITTRADTQRSTTSTTYVSTPTDPLTITVPLVGDYDVIIWANVRSPGGVGQVGLMSYSVGATAASDTWAIQAYVDAATAVETGSGIATRQTGVAASTQIIEKIRTTIGTIFVSRRRMFVMPVRVG